MNPRDSSSEHPFAKFLVQNSIKIESVQIFERPDRTDKAWDPSATHWQVRLTRYANRANQTLITYYSMGSAHKGSPKLADVMSCLVSGADCGEYTFEEYCSNFGIDTDSRKGHETWELCQLTNAQLRVFLGAIFEETCEMAREY